MNSTHFIRDFNLDISFPCEADALAAASPLSSFVSERLVAVAHEVFNRSRLAEGMVLSINSMEVDLGDLPARGYYAEAETRFRRSLEERIALEVDRHRAFPRETSPERVSLIQARQRDLDLVVYWIENGYLPWNAPACDLTTLLEMLDRVAWQQGAQLRSRLWAAAFPRAVARRLAWHSSGELKRRIAGLLRPANSSEEPPAAPNPEPEGDRVAWEIRFMGLLEGSYAESPYEGSTYKEKGYEASSGGENTRKESDNDPADVPGNIRQAIATGDPNPSGASFEHLLRRYPDAVAALVRSEGARPEAIRAMAAGFDDRLLALIVELLEPAEARFVLAAIGHQVLYAEAAKTNEETATRLQSESAGRSLIQGQTQSQTQSQTQGQTQSQTQSQTQGRTQGQTHRPTHGQTHSQIRAMSWESALSSLLADRGSEFNRHSFLRGMVRRMAARQNRDYASMLLSLHEALRASAEQSPDDRALLSVVEQMRREAPLAPSDFPEGMSADGAPSGAIPRAGRTETPPESPDSDEVRLRDLMQQVAADPLLRARIAHRLSPETLLEWAAALAPAHRDFIRDLTRAFEATMRGLGEGLPVSEARCLLREVILAQLAGGRFDRPQFLQGLLYRLAGRYSVDPRQLLDAVEAALATGLVTGESQDETLSLVREVRESNLGTLSDTSQELWLARFEAALSAGDTAKIAALWRSRSASGRAFEVGPLLGLLRQLSAEPARRHLLAAIPLDVVREAVEAASRDFPVMLRIVELAGTLSRAIALGNADSARPVIWHALLRYASRQGTGRFDQRACMDTVLRSLAAHHNLRYTDVLSSIDRIDTLEDLSEDAAVELMLPALRTLARESRAAASARDPEPSAGADASGAPSSIERLHESYALYDAVMSCAARSNPAEVNELTTLLCRLRDESHATWRRIAREAVPLAVPAPATSSSRPAGLSPVFIDGVGWAIPSPAPARSSASAEAGGTEGSVQVAGARPDGELRYFLIRDRKLSGPLADAICDTISDAVDDLAICAEDLAGEAPASLASLRLAPSRLAPSTDLLNGVSANSRTLGGLARLLPERRLATLLLARAPRGFERQIAMAELMADAADLHDHAALWEFLFARTQAPEAMVAAVAASDDEFADALLDHLAVQSGTSPMQLYEVIVSRLRQSTELSAKADVSRTLAALSRVRPQAPARPEQAAPATASRPLSSPLSSRVSRPVTRGPRVQQSHVEPIFITNAGLVLAGHYLPRLFDAAGLFEAGRFKHQEAAHRGVCLLQYLADGSVEPPEHLLPLNKVLCGFEPEEPIATRPPLRPSETEVADGLLEAILAHWSALGRTSVLGLRESFLQREGRLSLAPPAWQLLVEPRTFDMLLDRLPWSFKVIKHQWMEKALYVEWR